MLKEKNILFIIKYTPSIFIVLLAILTTFYISYTHSIDLEIQKEDIKKEFIQNNKNRVQSNINTISYYVEDEFSKSRELLKKQIKEKVYNAHSIMNSIYNKYKNEKSKDEIEQIIKAALVDIRFNQGRGYYFIYDLDGTSIFHPIKPHRHGKSFFNVKDINGVNIIQESISIAKSKSGEGFQNWHFHKPSDLTKEYEKIGFIKKFEPYDWFIGTGEYLDDFKNSVKKRILDHVSTFKYENNGYLFLFDLDGNILLSKNRQFDGLNLQSTKKLSASINDKFKKYIGSNKDSMFVEYEIKNADEKSHLKISYLKKLNDLNWIIGNGFNLEDINNRVEQKQNHLENEHYEQVKALIYVAFIITISLLIISFFMSKYIEKRFIEYKERLYTKEVIKFESMMKELREILDNLPMMIIYKDNKNNIVTVNKHTANSVGMSVDELSNVASKDIFPSDYEKYYVDDLEIIKSKKAKIGFVERYESKDGFKIIETSKIPVFDKKGEVQNIIVFMIDITEKESFREENEKKERMLFQQSKLATMGEMIANIAHQWRQPLSTISTASTGAKLQKEMDCLSDEQLNSALEAINNSAQYLSQTIDDFRNFFKPTKNRYTEFHIDSTIDKTLNLIASKFQSQSIEIKKDIEDVSILSLENELIQVLINILNNARDELVSISGRKFIFIKTYKKENSLFIEIKDNAKGIKLENIEKIFDAYFTTKGNNHGTGIGLYMSKDILTKLLNGDLRVENETYIYENVEYTGAKFTIQIDV